MDAWPATLPQYPLVSGYQRTLPDSVIRTQMDSGPAKTRRRSAAEPAVIRCALRVKTDQLAALEAFFRTTLLDGARAFTWIDWHSGIGETYRFRAPPVITTQTRAGRWDVELQLETVP